MVKESESQSLQSLVTSAQQAIGEASIRRAYPLPYAAPDRRPNPTVESTDKLRAGIFCVAALLFVVTALAFAPISAGRETGALFSTGALQIFLWPFIASCIFLSSLFSLLPHQLSSRRQRLISVYSTLAAAMMACALTLSAAFLLWPAALLAAASCACGLYGIRLMNRNTARNLLERLGTDAPVGLLTGFGLIFTAQLVFAAASWQASEHTISALLLTLALTVIASVAAHSERGRHSLALGFAAGMIAVLVLQWRTAGGTWWLSAVMALCAVIVVVAAENRRYQITHAEHRAARGEPLEF